MPCSMYTITVNDYETACQYLVGIQTFGELDCTGEVIDPSFLVVWPSLAFKLPLGNGQNQRESMR